MTENMTENIKGAKRFSKFAEAFRCPHCNGALQVVDLKSLKCSENHTFDFAKQGYVNLMAHFAVANNHIFFIFTEDISISTFYIIGNIFRLFLCLNRNSPVIGF